MYEYTIKPEDQDMIVNKTIKYLSSKASLEKFELLCLSICHDYSALGRDLSPKQMNIVGRIYYSRVYEYKKPTTKMIKDARRKATLELAKQYIDKRYSEDSIIEYLIGKRYEEDYILH